MWPLTTCLLYISNGDISRRNLWPCLSAALHTSEPSNGPKLNTKIPTYKNTKHPKEKRKMQKYKNICYILGPVRIPLRLQLDPGWTKRAHDPIKLNNIPSTLISPPACQINLSLRWISSNFDRMIRLGTGRMTSHFQVWFEMFIAVLSPCHYCGDWFRAVCVVNFLPNPSIFSKNGSAAE